MPFVNAKLGAVGGFGYYVIAGNKVTPQDKTSEANPFKSLGLLRLRSPACCRSTCCRQAGNDFILRWF
jgi:hypothetical protein